MDINKLQYTLQNLTNKKISLSDIARALDVSRSNISLRAKNNSEVTVSELETVQNYFGVRIFVLTSDNNFILSSNTNERIKDDSIVEKYELFGHRLSDIQDNLEYLDKDMAKLIGISEDRYRKIKLGKIEITGIELAKLAGRVDISLDKLIKGI